MAISLASSGDSSPSSTLICSAAQSRPCSSSRAWTHAVDRPSTAAIVVGRSPRSTRWRTKAPSSSGLMLRRAALRTRRMRAAARSSRSSTTAGTSRQPSASTASSRRHPSTSSNAWSFSGRTTSGQRRPTTRMLSVSSPTRAGSRKTGVAGGTMRPTSTDVVGLTT